MSIFSRSIDEISARDIEQICSDQIAESSQFEIKVRLPSRRVAQGPRRNSDGEEWVEIAEYARNEIAAEIVAFANSYGGTLVIGIDETQDKPSRATRVVPLSNCHELARRLRQSIFDVIDPPIPILEARGIPTECDHGAGVILLRVARSRRRPHRLTSNKEVYVRREDETVRIDMREIQDLTIRTLDERQRIHDEFASAVRNFQNKLLDGSTSVTLTDSSPQLAAPSNLLERQ